MARTIEVNYMARVEGEGALTIVLDEGRATDVKLSIFEPPRFFEGFLQGRSLLEAPDVTARICGICPVAYQMSACRAVEDAIGLQLPEQLAQLRRLLYCGEWIESHALHMFMLHLPDFLGYQDALSLAKDHPDQVKTGLRIKKAGNQIVETLGGREIHPINVKVGGFYRVPKEAELGALLPELRWARDAALESLTWFGTLEYPEFERDYEFVALHNGQRYPAYDGDIVSSRGLHISAREYDQHFEELHLEHSTALHSRIKGRGSYFCGPLARFNLNFELLNADIQAACKRVHLTPPCNNPFKSLMVRAAETAQAFSDAIDIIEHYQRPPQAAVPVTTATAADCVGYGCTEAPRGILYHRYEIDAQGLIQSAKIVPPTSQNQRTIEEDLLQMGGDLSQMPHEDASWRAEQAVRNYDPCISCSTHFLKLKFEEAKA